MNHNGRQRNLSRRGLLRQLAALGTATGAAGVLAACRLELAPAPAPGAPSVEPVSPAAKSKETSIAVRDQDVTANDITQVAFVKTSDRAEGVRQAIGLLGSIDVTNRHVLVKPNFNSSDPAPGSTHPHVLETVLQELHQRGAQSISLADRSGMGNTRRVMEKLGVFELADTYDVKPIVLDELEDSDWALIELPDSHWTQGFPFARCCLDAGAVVQTCCLKTHRYGGHFTMSLKNSVGLAAKYLPGNSHNFMHELHGSSYQRQMIAEINAAYTPALVVMDGVEAFVRGGPAAGEHVEANVVLAGTDRVAIDAVGVALLRYFGTTAEVSAGAIFQQAQIARAVELGLGVDSPQRIELVTADPDSEAYAAKIRRILDLG